MDLSIIVGCYLQEAYVAEAVASAKNQQFNGSFEVIEHHDHCSTGSGTGISNAKNLAISRANGRRIIWVDADDKLPTNYAQTLWNAMQAFDGIVTPVFAGCPVQFISGPTLARFGLESSGVYSQRDLAKNLIIPTSSMFDKLAWEKVGGFSPYFLLCEDSEFWCRLLASGYRYLYREKTCLLKNNNSPMSMTHRHTELHKVNMAKLNELYGVEFCKEIV